MSIAASKMEVPHIHRLKDDLESILYVVLYCALLWLPVTSSHNLDWWFTNFFAVDHRQGCGGTYKEVNAVTRHYTNHLKTTQSQASLDWLNAALDLHYCDRGPNPIWDDGKALEDMWKESLEGELPEDDRHDNPVSDTTRREQYSLHLTTTERSVFRPL